MTEEEYPCLHRRYVPSVLASSCEEIHTYIDKSCDYSHFYMNKEDAKELLEFIPENDKQELINLIEKIDDKHFIILKTFTSTLTHI